MFYQVHILQRSEHSGLSSWEAVRTGGKNARPDRFTLDEGLAFIAGHQLGSGRGGYPYKLEEV